MHKTDAPLRHPEMRITSYRLWPWEPRLRGRPRWPRCLTCLRQRRLCLWEPQYHRHGAIHLDGCGQCCPGLLALAGGGVEGAEPQVAMRLQRTHPQGLGQGLAVMGGGLRDLRRLAPCRNVAEEAQGIRLTATLLVGTERRVQVWYDVRCGSL
jgi:hypothetical protein